MKKQGIETYLYSAVGVLAMLLLLIAVNALGSRAKTRIDLTSERAYTLSPGTKAILAKLDTPVQIRFYATRNENAMPPFLKIYAQRVEDLLGEIRQASKGLVEIQIFDPQPDSDAEDSAKLDGVTPQAARDGERLYLGLSVSQLDQKQAIAFLDPRRERLLEYDLLRAVSRVMTSEKPVLGLMSPFPLAGTRLPPMAAQMGQRNEPPWVLYSELQRDFTVKTVELTTDKIPDDVKVLLVIHPRGITDAAQYAIDQFVLRGGKLVAFLDPAAVLDRQAAQAGGMNGQQSRSTLEKLLKAWGLAFDTSRVVADTNYVSTTRAGRTPTVLTLTDAAANKDDVLTSDADSFIMAFAGAFTGTPAEGLKQTVLIKSSKNANLVDTFSAQMSGEEVMKDFHPTGIEYALAVRLTGKFKTAFPEGKPGAAAPKPVDPTKPEEKKPDAPPADGSLKESAGEGVVILVGDADMVQDQLSVQEAGGLGGQRIVMPVNGNLGFAQSAIEQLAGDSNLITVRSRASRERPFTVVKELQATAEANFRTKIRELESGLTEAQTKLSELQRSKDSGQRFILSPEQQAEITRFRKKEGEVKQQLKQERKKLRVEIDSLETRMKWLNIGLMPVMVAALGMSLAVLRRRRQAAV